MSIITLFTKKAPTMAGFAFDAVLSDDFEASVEVTTYPVETGVRIADHRIYLPMRWTITGAVSDNPLKPSITDFIGGGLSNFIGGDSSIVAGVFGLSASFLAGSNETRASAALLQLLAMMQAKEVLSIDAGDINLNNMVITKISRTKDPENEAALIFVAELQELITLDRLSTIGDPSVEELRDGDQSKSAIARIVSKGQKIGKEIGDNIRETVNSILGG